MIKEVDQDGNNEIDFDEFVMLMVKKLKETDTSEEELIEVFKAFDKDGDEKLDFDDLYSTLRDLGEKVTELDVKEMIEEHDLDADKKLNFEEFVRMLMAK
jgi:calmodulin